MMEDNLKEEMAGMAMGNGQIAGGGINKNGTPYNAGGNPIDKFGEPPVHGKTNILKRNVNLLNRPSLLPNTKAKKPLRNILGDQPIGRV